MGKIAGGSRESRKVPNELREEHESRGYIVDATRLYLNVGSSLKLLNTIVLTLL